MLYTISNGSVKDINVGDFIRCVKGSLPPALDGQAIEILAVDDAYPYAQLEPDQLSAIDPLIILPKP
jgi:hypothetical protein